MYENTGAATAEHIHDQLRDLARRVAAVTADFQAYTGAAHGNHPQVPYSAPPGSAHRPPPHPQPAYPHPQPAYPPPQPAYPHSRPRPGSTYPPGAYAPSGPARPPQVHAPHVQPRAQSRPAPVPSLSDRIASAAERGLIGRVLAAGGVAITLVGVVLLLVLAAQAGLLRPEIRVAGGAVFAAGLFAAGAFIGRRTSRRPGAIALVATGVAAALFDALAAASVYAWLPPLAAVVTGGAVAGAGLYLAHRWDSQTLCLMVSLPLLVFAPIVTGGVDEVLIGFMLAYAAATLWLQPGRDWTALFLVNTAATTAPLLAASYDQDLTRWVFGAGVVSGVTLAVASAIVLLPSSTRGTFLALGSAAAALPVLSAATVLDRPGAAAVAGIGAAVLGAAALGTASRSGIPHACRVVWLCASAVAVLSAVLIAVSSEAAATAVLGIALVVAVAARRAGTLRSALLVVAASFAALGGVLMVAAGAVDQLLVPGALPDGRHIAALVTVLMAVAATAALIPGWAAASGPHGGRWRIGGGLVMLWLVTQLCISVADVVTGGTATGFRAGHTVATLLWFGAAAAALVRARSQHGRTRTITLSAGLAVIAAAVAKLLLFDLAALDGLFRVIAFVVAGSVLLGLGVAYAQRLTDDGERPATQDAPTASGH